VAIVGGVGLAHVFRKLGVGQRASTGTLLSTIHNTPFKADSNAILKLMDAGEPPPGTAAQKADAEKFQAIATEVGAENNIPPALILGIMSRESGFGKGLDANGYGDFGHAFGVMQIDKRSHTPRGGPYSKEHIEQAVRDVLLGFLSIVKKKFPNWKPEEQLAGAVASYNAGSRIHVEPIDTTSWIQMDAVTTGKNYSRDTWARARWFADNLTW
jgi:soluble lytic murein transglycosylase-like protein